MRFEEVLPALREGEKITNSVIKDNGYQYIHYLDEIIFNDKGGTYHLTDKDIIEPGDWEIVGEKKKVKLRDLTLKQLYRYCITRTNCRECAFRFVICYPESSGCWINHKDLYSDKFLDQEIEIEEE